MEKDILEQIFSQELSLIKNEQLKELALNILSSLNDDWFSIPTSSTGKYHPRICNKKHGLVLHTKLVCQYSKVLIEAAFASKDDPEKYYKKRDIIITAALLHDIAKQRRYANYDDYNNHPIIASDIINKEFKDNKIFYNDITEEVDIISDIVVHHMGIFSPETVNKDVSKYQIEYVIVYFADYLASMVNQNKDSYLERIYQNLLNEIEKQK